MVLATSVSSKRDDLFQSEGKTQYSKSYCESLANQLKTVSELPMSCRQYGAVVETLEKKQDVAVSDPFAGMHPGAAVKARAARANGQEHHAQIQRRLTATGSRRFSKLDK